MSEVKVGKNESLDSALKRFKRSCQKSGVMQDIRKHDHYEKPSIKKKKKFDFVQNKVRADFFNLVLWRFYSASAVQMFRSGGRRGLGGNSARPIMIFVEIRFGFVHKHPAS